MHMDAKLFKMLIQNFDEAYRSAKLIILSFPRVKRFFPLSGISLKDLDIEALDKLDAFRARFCDLQHALGRKVFRSLLCLEMESLGSNLDVLNQIEKRDLISSFESWQEIKNIRNLFIHDYPDTLDYKAKILTAAFEKTPELIHVINNIIRYFQKTLKVELHEYAFLKLEL